MNLDHVPLLKLQRDLQGLPRGMERFKKYLGAVLNQEEETVELPSLLVMNPMGKEHVTGLLDALLDLDADGIAAKATSEASARLMGEPGDFKVALVIADDRMGGWTNRVTTDFTLRFGPEYLRLRAGAPPERPRWQKHAWITAALWSSEPASERAVREAVVAAIFRTAYAERHGPARKLRDMLAQEGYAMALAGCAGPVLDAEDIAYTREVLAPLLDSEDMRVACECLFGDAEVKPLGFTPRGLSHRAGLALALHDARDNAAL